MDTHPDQPHPAALPPYVRKDGNTGALAGAHVIVVSHGFQPNYERGFVNGLASNGVEVTLVSSDRTETPGLLQGVTALNLRGSQDASRPALAKAMNLLRYHLRLMWLTLTHRNPTDFSFLSSSTSTDKFYPIL